MLIETCESVKWVKAVTLWCRFESFSPVLFIFHGIHWTVPADVPRVAFVSLLHGSFHTFRFNLVSKHRCAKKKFLESNYKEAVEGLGSNVKMFTCHLGWQNGWVWLHLVFAVLCWRTQVVPCCSDTRLRLHRDAIVFIFSLLLFSYLFIAPLSATVVSYAVLQHRTQPNREPRKSIYRDSRDW